jgi:hypothetical protein
MDKEAHRQRHIELHRALDELLADFITHTGQRPSQTTLLQFLEWSHKQTVDPEPIRAAIETLESIRRQQ